MVFWNRPAPGEEAWRLLAVLRRMRIRLRWQVEDVWLLAAGARADLFGGQLSAVRGSARGAAWQAVGGKLMSLALGLGGQSLIWGPVATAIVWGLAFSSVLTLILIPLLYRLSRGRRGAADSGNAAQ